MMTKDSESGFDWQVEWGVAHQYPQLVFTKIISVNQEHNQQVKDFYQNLHNMLYDS